MKDLTNVNLVVLRVRTLAVAQGGSLQWNTSRRGQKGAAKRSRNVPRSEKALHYWHFFLSLLVVVLVSILLELHPISTII